MKVKVKKGDWCTLELFNVGEFATCYHIKRAVMVADGSSTKEALA